jgi:hypothetical protein
MTPDQFILNWQNNSLKERSSSQSHFNDLCRLYDHPTPHEKDPEGNTFCFEKGASKRMGGNGWADVWYKDHFAIEYKGPGVILTKAFDQLDQYRASLQNPPLLIACNIQSFVIKTNFQNTIEEILTIPIQNLRDQGIRQKLGYIFTDPQQLKPKITRDQVTIQVSKMIGTAADSIRNRGFAPKDVARFLDRVIFCLFAEDAGLLPINLFSDILSRHRESADGFTRKIKNLFTAMNSGGEFGTETIPHFNGQLFHDTPVLELIPSEIRIIHDAALLKWNGVNPAIFGTMFERVLSFDTKKRAQLGAHYTSEADINVLIEPVILAPLRDEWHSARDRFLSDHKRKHLDTFHTRLQAVSVLDPACGSGNFLYVSLQKLLDVELDVLNTYQDAGLPRPSHGIGPWNLRGIEKDPVAFQLAQMAVWIGYLQWMANHGVHRFAEPILRSLTGFHNMDAILKCDDQGNPVTPPEEPVWPAAEFIVGNPPFLGDKKMRGEMGDTYVEAVRKLYKGRIPGQSDLCCYWFEKARQQLVDNRTKRVGLLATQGIRGGANREVLKRIKESGDIFFAESDRGWIQDGANVHVSIVGFEINVATQPILNGKKINKINTNLDYESNIAEANKLIKNQSVGFIGPSPHARFDIEHELALKFLKESCNHSGKANSDVLKPVISGVDITGVNRRLWTIDFGLMNLEKACQYEFPFEYCVKHIKETRIGKRGQTNVKWWQYERPRSEFREQLGLNISYISTPRVSKHRAFIRIGSNVLSNDGTTVFARSDDYFFGVLHSRLHEVWARAQGTQLRERESGFRYTPTTCFETFPFPEPTEPQRAKISEAARDLNEQRENWLNPPDWTKTDHLEFPATVGGPWSRYIDPTTHETRTFRGESFEVGTARWPRIVPRNADYAKMLKSQRTLTKLYNDRPTWLDLAHRRLDEAVATAYGWPAKMTDEDILSALLELNLSRPAVGQSATTDIEIGNEDD